MHVLDVLSPYPQPLPAASDISEWIQPSWVSSQWPANNFTASPISNSPRNFSSSPLFSDSGCFLDEPSDRPYSWNSFAAINHVDDSRRRIGSPAYDPQFTPTNRDVPDLEAVERYSPVEMTGVYGSRPLETGADESSHHAKKRKSVSVPNRQYKPARTRSSHHDRPVMGSKGRRKSTQTTERESDKEKFGLKSSSEAADSPRHAQNNRTPPPSKRALSDGDPPKVRHNHNITEKRYRSRLNDQFDTLLSALPASSVSAIEGSSGGKEPPGRKISKAEVLILAKEHIQALETSREDLEEQNRRLAADMEQLEVAWGRLVGRMMP
ncbi:hypothetical protein DL95DRAFT_446694 [Leptodontidium sp. 2 PMI_412]|nr:hypothetical protein DL95DRAFT_446694 [Leptodontidium sp. 2 PMI_412]